MAPPALLVAWSCTIAARDWCSEIAAPALLHKSSPVLADVDILAYITYVCYGNKHTTIK